MKPRWLDWVGVAVLLGFVGIVVWSNWQTGRLPNAYMHLSYAFAEGRVDVGFYGTVLDLMAVDGKLYLPHGPLPAILLLPYAWWRKGWVDNNSGVIGIGLNLVNAILVWRIALAVLRERWKAMWMVMAYMFASPYVGIAMESAVWYQGQLTAVTGVLFALWSYVTRKSWMWVGVGMAWAIAARLNVGLVGVFFLLNLLCQKRGWRVKVADVVKLGLPVAMVVVLLGWYNYARFGSVWESGYSKQMIHPAPTVKQRAKGWYRLENVPTNFYYYFLRGLDGVLVGTHDLGEYRLAYPYVTMDPDGPGWGFFYMAPVYLYLFSRRPKGVEEWAAWVVSGGMLVLLLLFFVPGSRQFGPRYTNDFLPLMFLVLLRLFGEKKWGVGVRVLILLSAILNMWVFASYNAIIKF